MRILVCGDRNWLHLRREFEILDSVTRNEKEVIVIEGEATGADTIGRLWAESRKHQVLPYPADWDKYGEPAGPIRNKQMLEDGRPDYVVGFHNRYKNSVGTRNMIEQAKAAGIHGELYSLRDLVETF